MEKICMSFNEICPCIRYVQHVQLNPQVPPYAKMTYDHRITYICGGKGMIEMEGRSYSCRKGDLFYWGPETRYAVHRDSENPLVVLNMNFDFTPNHREKVFIPPAAQMEEFCPGLLTEKIEFRDVKVFNRPFLIRNYSLAEACLLKISNEFKQQKVFFTPLINGLLQELLSQIARGEAAAAGRNSRSEIVDSIIEYIHEHCESILDNKKIAEVFNFHPNYINKMMVAHTGVSLHQYVLNVKIQKAVELMSDSMVPVAELAYMLGFVDASHFIKAFKKRMGVSPGGRKSDR